MLICSRPTAIVCRSPVADLIGVLILNMFNIGSRWQTIMKSVLESSDLGLELSDSSANSNADPAKVGIWVWVFSFPPISSSNVCSKAQNLPN